MADFDAAIQRVLAREGGYSNDPDDRGGETKFGISRRAYPDLDIASLTTEQAKEIYRRDYWRFEDIHDQAVAEKLLDMAVNFGLVVAIKLAQRAGNVRVDGVWGPQTQTALNRASGDALLQELRARCAVYYADIVANDATQRKFLLGWMRRAVA